MVIKSLITARGNSKSIPNKNIIYSRRIGVYGVITLHGKLLLTEQKKSLNDIEIQNQIKSRNSYDK